MKGVDGLGGQRVGVIGRTQANVTLLRVILTESGVNSEKVAITQFGTNQIAEMTRDPTLDAFMAVGPLDRKNTINAVGATAHSKREPKFLPVDLSEPLVPKRPLHQSQEIPGSTLRSPPDRPGDTV